jgi:dienelactone hydrolase
MLHGPPSFATIPLLALLLAGGIARAGSPETVEYNDGEITLKAMVYKPEGAGPFPAVIAMHDCSGLTNSAGRITAKYREWAQLLVRDGFVVLFPESFGSRGLGNQCSVRNRPVRPEHELVDDANASRRWSNGASSVLWTVRPQRKADDRPDFRSAVAFYPVCRRLESTAWSARVPTLILIGAADDVTSPQDCEHMVAGAKGRSARISIMVYPGALHDFDHPNRPPQMRTDYAVSADGTGRIHTGTNLAARADSLKRVPQWLAR